MSSFYCEKCGTAILDSGSGYITSCKHYPQELTVTVTNPDATDARIALAREFYMNHSPVADVRLPQLLADYADERTAKLSERVKELEGENERLRSQLPETMQHCTIRFRSCELGHGWLTATNWVEFDCSTCRRNLLLADNAELWERVKELAEIVTRQKHALDIAAGEAPAE